MSQRRLARLAENGLETALSGLEQQYEQLRGGTPQFIGGASILMRTSLAPGTFDWDGFLDHGGKLFQVVAVADTMSTFWGSCTENLFADTSTNLYDGLQYMTDYKNANSPITVNYTDIPNTSPTPNSKSWFVQVSGLDSRHLWIKFKVYGLDDATVTVTALS